MTWDSFIASSGVHFASFMISLSLCVGILIFVLIAEWPSEAEVPMAIFGLIQFLVVVFVWILEPDIITYVWDSSNAVWESLVWNVRRLWE